MQHPHNGPRVAQLQAEVERAEPTQMSASRKSAPPHARPNISAVPESSVLARVRAFLPAIQKANEDLRVQLQSSAGGARAVNIESVDESKPHIQMDLTLGVLDVRLPAGADGVGSAAAAVNVASVEANTRAFLQNRGISSSSSNHAGIVECVDAVDARTNPFASRAPASSSTASAIPIYASAATADAAASSSSSSAVPHYDFEPLPLPSAAEQHGAAGALDALRPRAARPLVSELRAGTLDEAGGAADQCDTSSSSSSSSDDDDDDDANADGVDFAALPVEMRTHLLRALASRFEVGDAGDSGGGGDDEMK